ncbi:MAG: hypothetical protein M3167_14630 [Acidobacteriota bacterium]|nr:hypothetical protein [Acidobacteriota bacterium]
MKEAMKLICATLFGVLVASAADAAQPCCGVSSVDPQSGVVSARVAATGEVFQFKVGNPTLLRQLAPGAAIDADFAARVAFVPGSPYRFAIVKMPEAPPPGTSSPASRPGVAGPAGPARVSPALSPEGLRQLTALKQKGSAIAGALRTAPKGSPARADWKRFLAELKAWKVAHPSDAQAAEKTGDDYIPAPDRVGAVTNGKDIKDKDGTVITCPAGTSVNWEAGLWVCETTDQ